ncbi:DEP domain-containing protein 7, partial [Frankliniella fusca]
HSEITLEMKLNRHKALEGVLFYCVGDERTAASDKVPPGRSSLRLPRCRVACQARGRVGRFSVLDDTVLLAAGELHQRRTGVVGGAVLSLVTSVPEGPCVAEPWRVRMECRRTCGALKAPPVMLGIKRARQGACLRCLLAHGLSSPLLSSEIASKLIGKDSRQGTFPDSTCNLSMYLSPVTENDIILALSKLKSKKCCGHDDITDIIVKKSYVPL